jgi:hypothetical protein
MNIIFTYYFKLNLNIFLIILFNITGLDSNVII